MMRSPAISLPFLFIAALGACAENPTEASAGRGFDAQFALGASGCHAVDARGQTFSSFQLTPAGPVPLQFYPLWDGGPPLVPGFQSVNSISVAIDGIDASADLVVTTKLLGQTPRGSGATHASTSHIFELAGSDGDSICEPGEDCFQTADKTVLTPTTQTGLLGLHGLLAIELGHGRFASPDRTPPLVAKGEIQFAPAPAPTVASWELNGNLCTAS